MRVAAHDRVVHTHVRRSTIEAEMNVSQLHPGERVRDVRVTEHTLAVDLLDGRTIIVPLAWFP